LACVFLGTTGFLVWQQSRPIPGPTDENYSRIKEGLTLQQVEQILGPGRPGHVPLPSSEVNETPESAEWKYWTNPKTQLEGWEAVYTIAFVDGQVARICYSNRPNNPEPVRFVKPDFSSDKLLKLLQPQMGDARKFYQYRGGYIDCWVEVATNGKKEVVSLVSNEQLRMKRQKMTVEMESEVYGQIIWDYKSLEPNDLTLLVTATGHQAQGFETTTGVQRGTNHLIKEKWPDLWNGNVLEGFQDTSTLTQGEEKLLYAIKLTDGEIRLMCKLIVQGK
jgi:hypothetical protein